MNKLPIFSKIIEIMMNFCDSSQKKKCAEKWIGNTSVANLPLQIKQLICCIFEIKKLMCFV